MPFKLIKPTNNFGDLLISFLSLPIILFVQNALTIDGIFGIFIPIRRDINGY